jgi:hypothetical protein
MNTQSIAIMVQLNYLITSTIIKCPEDDEEIPNPLELLSRGTSQNPKANGCQNCKYFSDNEYLRCAVNPTGDSASCKDFET